MTAYRLSCVIGSVGINFLLNAVLLEYITMAALLEYQNFFHIEKKTLDNTCHCCVATACSAIDAINIWCSSNA